jgi:type III secretion system-like peptide-binding chaperone
VDDSKSHRCVDPTAVGAASNGDEVRVVPGDEAVRTFLAATLRRLGEEGGSHNYVILEVNDEKNYYVQFATSCGSAVVRGEAVSDRYVSAPLSPAQRASLQALGWRRPTVRKFPNYYHLWTVLNDTHRLAIADFALETLEQVYGWRRDAPLQIKTHLNW